jgi:hypothetical protein
MPGVSLPIRVTLEGQNETIHPYICFGFKIQDALVYLSDVSYIPEGTWSMLEAQRENGTLPVLVLDCLGLRPHTSHFGLADSIATARRMGAARTYLTGFGHEVPHDDYVAIGEFAGGKYDSDTAELTTTQQRGISLIGEGRSIWLRPAHDGLRVFVNQEGIVKDESYDEILGNDAL